MPSNSIAQDYPLGLTSATLDFENYDEMSFFSDYGVGLLEITSIFPENKAWVIENPQSSVELRELCKKNNVQADSVHSFYIASLGHDMVSPDIDKRSEAIRINGSLFPAAKEIGARYIVVHLFNERVQRSPNETLKLAKDAVDKLIPYAEKTGVKIAIENLYADWSIREINTLLDELNHPLLGVCFDSGHSALYNAVGEELALCGDRLLGLHIHDNLLENDNHWLPFRGKIDWKDFAKGLVKTGYKGPLLFESFEREENESREQFIAASVDAHQRLLSLIEEAM